MPGWVSVEQKVRRGRKNALQYINYFNYKSCTSVTASTLAFHHVHTELPRRELREVIEVGGLTWNRFLSNLYRLRVGKEEINPTNLPPPPNLSPIYTQTRARADVCTSCHHCSGSFVLNNNNKQTKRNKKQNSTAFLRLSGGPSGAFWAGLVQAWQKEKYLSRTEQNILLSFL